MKYLLILVASLALGAVIVPPIIKYGYAWIIPQIAPGMVKEGLIVKEITWSTSFKVWLILTILFGLPDPFKY